MLIDATGLWWIRSTGAVDTTITMGSIQGPQMIKYGSYYYLFYAAGTDYTATYVEAVARSTSVMGIFEKMKIPILSNGIVGYGRALSSDTLQQLYGPGHATVIQLDTNTFRIAINDRIGLPKLS